MNEKQPLMTFIVTIFNTAKWTDVAIKSILDQDYENIEIIVVDDCSKDDSVKRMREYEKDGVYIIENDKNMGPTWSRNRGFEHSKGDYIFFMDIDIKLKPGIVSKQVKFLEEHPEFGFYYGGYNICDDDELENVVQEYRSQEYDRYFLKQFNYISGGSIVRRECLEYVKEKYGYVWHPTQKSLQDWDLWCRVTEKYTPFYSPEIHFNTYLPGSSGISVDSKDHWLERITEIRNRYGFPINDICVSSLGAPLHGRKMAKILGADFVPFPMLKPNKYKMIYLLGFYPQAMDNHAAVFQNFKGVRLIHWIGTDVLQFMGMPYKSGLSFKKMMNGEFKHQMTEVEYIHDELKEMGIETDVVPLPVELDMEVTPLPKEFCVAVYIPGTNRDVHNLPFLQDLFKIMPDIKFKVFGTASEVAEQGNVQYCGRIEVKDMPEFIKNTSALLRITTHDGLPVSLCEWIMAGRNVIFNKQLPFVEKVGMNQRDIADVIRRVKTMELNEAGAEFYRKWLDPKKYKKKINSYLK